MPPLDANQTEQTLQSLAATGIEGLDDVLNGGLVRGRLYLVEGVPGCPGQRGEQEEAMNLIETALGFLSAGVIQRASALVGESPSGTLYVASSSLGTIFEIRRK